jgi:aryl-alcohol dehydrogenase-like predicted oxidoreductase
MSRPNQTVQNSHRPTPGGTFPLAGRPTARELGITHFDTAQFYGNGLANELIRDSVGGRRDDIVIATKAGAKPVPGAQIPLTAAQKPVELRAAVEDNLRTLGTDRIDIVNLRRMDFTPGLLAEGDQIVPFDDQLAEMTALRDEGKILAVGLSHITVEQFVRALPVGIACVQNIYNMVDRSGEQLLDLCAQNGVAWFRTSPSAAGSAPFPKSSTRMPSEPSQRGSG